MVYIVIVRVANKEYLTKVEAQSLLSAEHLILDEGVCTRFGYGVEGAMAYDAKTMKTDTFIGNALSAEPISHIDLVDIIHRNNEYLKEKVVAHERVVEIEKMMKKLTEELEAAKKVLVE